MNKIKFFLIYVFIIFLYPIKSFSLIEVDITRGNLNPLPLAVSPLSIDEESKKSFEKLYHLDLIEVLFLQANFHYMVNLEEYSNNQKFVL